jgi:glycosyltransferase involved in cell wall biosynthesis
MKVTIITACYNRADTIKDCIESVLGQDYDDIEYIIIDGASDDDTMEIVGQYENRITKILSEPDCGMYEAINKGIRMSTGDIIGMVHSDDKLYTNHTVSDIVRELEETQADIVYGNGLYFSENGKCKRNWISGRCSKGKIKLGWLPLHTTTYIKKSCYDAVGLYDESLKIAADTDMLLRLLHDNDNFRTAYLNEYVIKMRMGGLSTSNLTIYRMYMEDISVLTKHHIGPAKLVKIFKMMWKVPQYISALFVSSVW